MAAILCNGLINLCEGACLNCGKICTLPCRVLSSVCKPLCDATATLCSSPFCIYGTVAFLFNIPPIVVGLMALPNVSNGCQASIWLLVNVPLCIINIIAAWYIAVRIQNRDDPQLRDKRTSLSRASYLLCYDPWVAVYILILIGFFAWLCTGVSWKATGEINANGSCEDNVLDLVNSSIGCGFSFLTIGFSALCISLCVAWCDGREYQDDSANNQGGNGYHNIEFGNNRVQVAVATPADKNTYKSPAAPPRRDPAKHEANAAALGAAVGTTVDTGINVVKNVFRIGKSSK